MNALLEDLMSFYARLDEFMRDSDRDCGICGECCKKLHQLRVYPVELENIRRHVADNSAIKKFQNFAKDVYKRQGYMTIPRTARGFLPALLRCV